VLGGRFVTAALPSRRPAPLLAPLPSPESDEALARLTDLIELFLAGPPRIPARRRHAIGESIRTPPSPNTSATANLPTCSNHSRSSSPEGLPSPGDQRSSAARCVACLYALLGEDRRTVVRDNELYGLELAHGRARHPSSGSTAYSNSSTISDASGFRAVLSHATSGCRRRSIPTSCALRLERYESSGAAPAPLRFWNRRCCASRSRRRRRSWAQPPPLVGHSSREGTVPLFAGARARLPASTASSSGVPNPSEHDTGAHGSTYTPIHTDPSRAPTPMPPLTLHTHGPLAHPRSRHRAPLPPSTRA